MTSLLGVLLPVTEKVVAAHVGFVTDRDEARHAEIAARRLVQDGDPEAAATATRTRCDRARAATGANVAFMDTSGAVLTRPMQLGPTSRMPCRRAA